MYQVKIAGEWISNCQLQATPNKERDYWIFQLPNKNVVPIHSQFDFKKDNLNG